MKALSNRRDQKHGGQQNRDTHVLISCLSGFCSLFGNVRSLFIQAKKLLVLRIVVLGHEDRPRRCLRVVERIGPHPSCEGEPVLIAKSPLEELRRHLLALEPRDEPTVEGVAVVDSLLSCQSGKTFSHNPESTRLGVLFCALSSPLRCRVPTPRSGDSD